MTRRPMPLDGPQVVHGVGFVVDADGEATQACRPAVAICRCDASARRPWCDGTHKLLARRSGRAQKTGLPPVTPSTVPET